MNYRAYTDESQFCYGIRRLCYHRRISELLPTDMTKRRSLLSQFLLLLTLCLWASGSLVLGQGGSGSPVILDGKTVITIQWGYGNFTPAVRAGGVSTRLKSVAENSAEPLTLTQQVSPLGINIRCGDVILASVFAGDAQEANTTQAALAQQWSNSFLSAMESYRAKYNRKQIVLHTLLALLTIALCIWLLLAVQRGTKRIATKTSAVLEKRMKGTQSRIAPLVSGTLLHTMVMRAFTVVRLLLLLVIATFTLHALLGIFPQTRPLATQIYEGIAQPARSFFHSFWVNLPSLLFIILLGLVTWYLIRLVRYFFAKVAEGSITVEGFRPAWSTVTERLVSIAILVLAALVAYPYIPGSQSAAFKSISLFLGVLVSLGSTGLVANIITGIMLTYMDAFEVGDLVQIGEINAYVKQTSLLTTRLITRKNEIITLPNSYIMGKHITNFTAHGGKDSILISATVGIGYEVPWRQVEAMLLEAAAKTESVLKDPAPFALTLSLENYSVNYEINAYLKPDVRRYVGIAELNRNVLDAFNKYGVAIMTPSYMADPAEPKVVAKDNWFAAPANPQQTAMPEPRDYPPSRS